MLASLSIFFFFPLSLSFSLSLYFLCHPLLSFLVYIVSVLHVVLLFSFSRLPLLSLSSVPDIGTNPV